MSNPKVPFLPGYSFEMPKDNYSRMQRFAVKNGVMVTDQAYIPPAQQVGPSQLETSVRLGTNNTQNRSAYRPPTQTGPTWVQYENKVLRFYAYFKEPVHSSAQENMRVRHCAIFFYLEDGSMQVTETRVDNSGIPQGTFIKRHRFPRDDTAFFKISDLKCGTTVKIYGRQFRLYKCDGFTRQFMEENGFDAGEEEEAPADPFTANRQAKRTVFNKTMNPLKTFMEANTGRSWIDVKATKKFLDHDGEVLRFFCTWADPTDQGESRPYVLMFFLADDTVEVNEIVAPNSGRGTCPSLLKRSRLPRDYRNSVASVATIGDRSATDSYTAKDFYIGATINVFGRDIIIRGSDQWTKQYYIDHFGASAADFPEFHYEEKHEEVAEMPIPPYTGFGTEEDSLGSWKNLVPKAPKKNFTKFMAQEGKNLCFVARFTNPSVEDESRRFVITYYMQDDSVSVFEKAIRNSGFMGGKFLQRSKLRRTDHGNRPFAPHDFFTGATMLINHFSFTLLGADEFTYGLMESDPAIFPRSDIQVVQKNLRAKGLDGQAVAGLVEAFKAIDTDGSGKIDAVEFRNLLEQQGCLPEDEHQLITLLRKYDANKDGEIDFIEFVNAVTQ